MRYRDTKIKISPLKVYHDIKNLAASLDNHIAALILFGSYARGEETPLSDVDIAYLLEDGLSPIKEEEIDRELYISLSKLLNTDEITLANLKVAAPSIAFQALKYGRTIYSRQPELLSLFTERLLALYYEIKEFRREALAEFSLKLKGAVMDIDRERLLFYLRYLKEEIEYLKVISRLSSEEYLSDVNIQIVMERRFQRAIESCLNIGNHIISRLGLKLAEDYASIFRSLAESQVLSENMAEKMADMARFRNLLVHLYWEIDHKRIYGQSSEKIEVLEDFIREIYGFIEKRQSYM